MNLNSRESIDLFIRRKRDHRVNKYQKSLYVEFLEKYFWSMINKNDDKYLPVWNQLADALNEYGPPKSVEDWQKVFVNWRYQTNKKLKRINAKRKSGSMSPLTNEMRLTSLEERAAVFWAQIGKINLEEKVDDYSNSEPYALSDNEGTQYKHQEHQMSVEQTSQSPPMVRIQNIFTSPLEELHQPAESSLANVYETPFSPTFSTQKQKHPSQQQYHNTNSNQSQSSTSLKQNFNKQSKQTSSSVKPTTSHHQRSHTITSASVEASAAPSFDRNKSKDKYGAKHKMKSKELFSAAYDFLHKSSNKLTKNCDGENDEFLMDGSSIETFGNYIDAELTELDENSLAVVIMKIMKILHEARVGAYKDAKIDKEENNSVVLNDDAINDSDPEILSNISSHRHRKRKRYENDYYRANKENRMPISSSSSLILQPHDPKSNKIDPHQATIYKKKRLKSSDVLTAVYDALKTELNGNESRTTFGSYVSNELKTMDKVTISKAKLNICRVLCEASMGKYKRSSQNDILNDDAEDKRQQSQHNNQENKKQTTASTNKALPEPTQEKITESENLEIIIPKVEIIEDGYDL